MCSVRKAALHRFPRKQLAISTLLPGLRTVISFKSMLGIFRREGTNIRDKEATLSHKSTSFTPGCADGLSTLDKLMHTYNLMPGMLQNLTAILGCVS